MDSNKLQKLKEINYMVAECCDICQHSRFERGQIFGTCMHHNYRHKKHTGPQRELSIIRFGYCDSFLLTKSHGLRQSIHAYAQFLDEIETATTNKKQRTK